ncbi:zinc-dependent peptidase [Tenacibaculum amylolyticum]|uniref:zinc-dependent peptidase n=1 Tax=Tenacibaculum amylolyticum TaxID=104269 RepID=UPI0038964E68
MKSFHLLKLTLFAVGGLTTVLNVVESFYVYIFHKPIFVHLYFMKKKLPKNKKEFLVSSIEFYQKLEPKYQSYYEHRVAKFIRSYEFVERDGFEITPEMKVLIASSYVKLTFGMRRYLTATFQRVIIYPEVYYSLLTKQYHKGEFNPAFKTISFSWEDFLMGDIITNDNINLGIHEFAHALTFHGSSSRDASARIFYRFFKRISNFLDEEENIKEIQESAFFREYAMTNKLEFVAVILEHFFESPKELQQQFPRLYAKIEAMLNYKSILDRQ